MKKAIIFSGLLVISAIVACNPPVPYENLDLADQHRARVYDWLADQAVKESSLWFRLRHALCTVESVERDAADSVTLAPARPALVEALRTARPRIRSAEECRVVHGWYFQEAESERPAAVIWVDSLVVVRSDSVSVRGGFLPGGLAGAAYWCAVVDQQGSWRLGECKLAWIH